MCVCVGYLTVVQDPSLRFVGLVAQDFLTPVEKLDLVFMCRHHFCIYGTNYQLITKLLLFIIYIRRVVRVFASFNHSHKMRSHQGCKIDMNEQTSSSSAALFSFYFCLFIELCVHFRCYAARRKIQCSFDLILLIINKTIVIRGLINNFNINRIYRKHGERPL